MSIRKVAVIGAGIMGNGITQVCASKGLNVLLLDIQEAIVQRGYERIGNHLAHQVSQGKISQQEMNAALARIKTSTCYEDIQYQDIAIESATENELLKLDIIRRIDQILDPEGIIVSNTSSISVTRLASVTKWPERVMGLHFFNPPPRMELVEAIRGKQTSDACFAKVIEFSSQIGRTAIPVKNSPGFLVNRVLIPMLNEAICTLQEGLATAEEIDLAMKLGCNMPMGPLALADLIGLDTCKTIMETFYQEFNESKYRPALLLKEMVDAGFLGKKSGRGFYAYP